MIKKALTNYNFANQGSDLFENKQIGPLAIANWCIQTQSLSESDHWIPRAC